MQLSNVSKAIAGAVVATLIALLAKYNVVLDVEQSAAVTVLINGVIAAVLGYVAVYFAPKNKE